MDEIDPVEPFFSVGVVECHFRACDLQLCLNGGSVYMDMAFEKSGGVVSLRASRVSFDGFGCWRAKEDGGNKINRMDQEDADLLMHLASSEKALLSSNEVKLKNAMILASTVIRKYLIQNQHCLWRDALVKHNLI